MDPLTDKAERVQKDSIIRVQKVDPLHLQTQAIFIFTWCVLGQPEHHRRQHESNILTDIGVAVIRVSVSVGWYYVLENEDGLCG